MTIGGERDEAGGPQAERIAGLVVVGRGAPGPLVVDSGGRQWNAVPLPRERAEVALRGGLGRLGPHPHRQHLVDVGVQRGGLVLLTGPPVVRTLESVLEAGTALPPGVLVTLLAPVVSALRDAAAAGVHSSPEADAIGLTEEGRPVLLLSEATAASSEPGVCAAVRGLLGRCRQNCPEWRGSPSEDDDLAALEALLYRSAAPLPLSAARRPEPAPDLDRPTGVREAPPARHRRTHPLDGWRERVLALVRRRRGPLAAATIVLVGALATTAFGPARGTTAESHARASAPPSVAPSVSPSPSASASASASPSPSPSPASPSAVPPSASTPTETPHPTVRPPSADAGAEEAAIALLAAARECGTSADACVRALTTPDSPLRSDGGDALATLRAASSTVTAVHADVNGASAVVVIGPAPGTTTASVLMIRTEAVWLLRDVFTDGGR